MKKAIIVLAMLLLVCLFSFGQEAFISDTFDHFPKTEEAAISHIVEQGFIPLGNGSFVQMYDTVKVIVETSYPEDDWWGSRIFIFFEFEDERSYIKTIKKLIDFLVARYSLNGPDLDVYKMPFYQFYKEHGNKSIHLGYAPNTDNSFIPCVIILG